MNLLVPVPLPQNERPFETFESPVFLESRKSSWDI